MRVIVVHRGIGHDQAIDIRHWQQAIGHQHLLRVSRVGRARGTQHAAGIVDLDQASGGSRTGRVCSEVELVGMLKAREHVPVWQPTKECG